MKLEQIDDVNSVITDFILKMSKYEDSFTEEAPDIWEHFLLILSSLSDISIFLESAKNYSSQQRLRDYNNLRVANGLNAVQELPGSLCKNCSVDFGLFSKNPTNLIDTEVPPPYKLN